MMLDTWIVSPEKSGSGIDYILRRSDHEGYGGMLLPLHAGLFWDGDTEASLIVEPDNTKISGICEKLGFQPHADCFDLHIKDGADSSVFCKREIAKSVKELRSYPIRRVRI